MIATPCIINIMNPVIFDLEKWKFVIPTTLSAMVIAMALIFVPFPNVHLRIITILSITAMMLFITSTGISMSFVLEDRHRKAENKKWTSWAEKESPEWTTTQGWTGKLDSMTKAYENRTGNYITKEAAMKAALEKKIPCDHDCIDCGYCTIMPKGPQG